MKFASLNKGPDGEVLLVSRDLRTAITIPGVADNLREILDHWDRLAPSILEGYNHLNSGNWTTAIPFQPEHCTAPLPRAGQLLDGCSYLHHVELERQARGENLLTNPEQEPLMHSGVSDNLLGSREPITGQEDWGVDFEAELAVITDHVPMGCSAENAHKHIRLITLCNDISMRNLIPGELAKGLGFIQSKPASSFGPVAVTPDELGESWQDGKLHLDIRVSLNGQWLGSPNCGIDMTFSFHDLIAYAARTRDLGCGTIIASGTISNRDPATGVCCLIDQRMLETIQFGEPRTPYMKHGDQVRIEILDSQGQSIFGAIEQKFISE